MSELTKHPRQPQSVLSVKDVHIKALSVTFESARQFDLKKVESSLSDISKNLSKIMKIVKSMPSGGGLTQKESAKFINNVLEFVNQKETVKIKESRIKISKELPSNPLQLESKKESKESKKITTKADKKEQDSKKVEAKEKPFKTAQGIKIILPEGKEKGIKPTAKQESKTPTIKAKKNKVDTINIKSGADSIRRKRESKENASEIAKKTVEEQDKKSQKSQLLDGEGHAVKGAGDVADAAGLSIGGPFFAAFRDLGAMVKGDTDSFTGKLKRGFLNKAEGKFGIKDKAEKAFVKFEDKSGITRLMKWLEGDSQKAKEEKAGFTRDKNDKLRDKEGKFVSAKEAEKAGVSLIKEQPKSKDIKQIAKVEAKARIKAEKKEIPQVTKDKQGEGTKEQEETNSKLDAMEETQEKGFKSVVKAVLRIDSGSGIGGGFGRNKRDKKKRNRQRKGFLQKKSRGLSPRGGGFKGILKGGKGMMKGLGAFGAILSAGLLISESIDVVSSMKGANMEEKGGALGNMAGKEAGGMAGAAGGAAMGAAIGSIIPIVGTLIGGALGGLIGYFGGDFLGKAIGLDKIGESVGSFFGGLFDSDPKPKETKKTSNIDLKPKEVKKLLSSDSKNKEAKKLSNMEKIGESVGSFFGGFFGSDSKNKEAKKLSNMDKETLSQAKANTHKETRIEKEKLRIERLPRNPLDTIPSGPDDETLSLIQQGRL